MQPTTAQATKKDNSSDKKDNFMLGSNYDPACVIA
ncbi:hypothetical protein ZYGR_0Z02320 [Zygosaccharomyces rouxii]|uniref:Uncharacterized protein n=1 Tax=Zygosaccharomyces rouxii TaxID=4956 RepID=A0A1Q3A535_ZYGRO|nr:hypothetical protein ZYGR_0Z02320 [Zygosaccharomyces rouxii]